MAEQIDDLRAHGLERRAELAVLHRAGAGQRALGRRVEQAEQTLGLGERELVVEKGALGELAGPRRARAEFEAGADDALDDVRVAVAGDFRDVLAGEGMGRAPEGEHDIVERAARVSERAVGGMTGRGVDFDRDEPRDDGVAFRSAEADDRERGDAGRRAQGDDGVGHL
jgi:hypothetical protein